MSTKTDSIQVRELLEKAGLSQRQGAKELGINERTMRRYCSPSEDDAPKTVILALENLANARS